MISSSSTSVAVVSGSAPRACSSVTTTGAQSYHDAVLLTTNTTLASLSSGMIRFFSSVDGGQTLLVRSDGTTEFDGPVGGATPLAGLHVQGYSANGVGTTDINGGSVTTAGAAGSGLT